MLLLRQVNLAADAAERAFRAAIDLARRREERSLELRGSDPRATLLEELS